MVMDLKSLQKQLDERTLNPRALNKKQRAIIDELIKRGDLKGPSTGELSNMMDRAAQNIARREEFYADPIAAALAAEDNPYFLSGRPSAELAGDISGSIAPYLTMKNKIYGAAKSGNLWQKGPGVLTKAATKLSNNLPGRLKLLGGAFKLLARAADVPAKIWQSPLGRAEIYSVLGGTAGAGAGSVSYDMLNEQAGVAISSAITDAFADIPDREIDQDITLNSLRAMNTALKWNAGAAALTPLILGPLGKLGKWAFGAKSAKAKELAEYTRDKGLPLPLMTGIEDGVLSNIGRTYFKTVGVFPFVSGIGREALEGAEQAAGRQFLNSLTAYAPLMKTSALSSSIYNQASKVFKDNVALIGSKYKAFDTLAETVGNPKIISLDKTKKYATEFLERYKASFPDLDEYALAQQGAKKMEVEQLLKAEGDPLNLFMKAIRAIDQEALITPKQYKGLMQMLNRAIEGTAFNIPTGSVWALREALENDFNSFGANLTKSAFLKDETIKETYENISKTQGKEFADTFINKNIKDAEQLYNKLYDANATFSSVMGFYQKMRIPKSLQKFDADLFTQRGVNGILGRETALRDTLFETMERDVFQSNSPEAIEQFKVILGATGKQATKNGKALFDAAKARYMFNAFLDSFDSAGSPQARSIFRDVIDNSPQVKAGTEYAQDAMKRFGTDEMIESRGFSMDNVRLNNGIFDVTNIRFSPKDFADFNINKFMNKLGIGEATADLGREKMVKLLGNDGANEFYKFTNFMKAISDIPISDTSTFLQRRFTLSGGRGLAGGLIMGGGMFMANPFAPAIFLYLARKAGRILTDPTALRYMNDALLPEELIKGLKGKKIGYDSKFKIRSINPKLTLAGLTQKREAFARFMNYVIDEDKDLPRINPKSINLEEIQNELLKQPYSVPQPRYDNNNIPKENIEAMFSENFLGSSGNVERDNEMVDYVQSTIKSSIDTKATEVEREEEANATSQPIELEDVVTAVQTQAGGQGVNQMRPQGNTVTPQKLGALFPQDQLSQLIASRRNNA
jgi:hypothetical protein